MVFFIAWIIFIFLEQKSSLNEINLLINYADLWLKKYRDIKILLDKSSATKVREHIPCGYSMSMIWTFGDIENKHNVCKGENCMEKFCELLKSTQCYQQNQGNCSLPFYNCLYFRSKFKKYNYFFYNVNIFKRKLLLIKKIFFYENEATYLCATV